MDKGIRRVIIVWWKDRKENTFEVFSSLKVFCQHYPQYNYHTLSNYLSKQKTAYETAEIRIERKVIMQKPAEKRKLELPRRLFWEFRYDEMDWDKTYRTVIGRVVERGTEKDWKEMLSYYGKKKVISTLKHEITYLSEHGMRLVEKKLGIKPEELRCYKRKQLLPPHWR